MINSEKITFNILSYGNFVLDYNGLKYVGSDNDLDVSEASDDLADSFNKAHAQNQHLTPLEAMGKVADYFSVTKDYISNVVVSNEVEIEGNTKNKRF